MSTPPPQTPKIDAVVYDFGNVVVRWSIAALMDEFFASDAERDHFLTTVLTPAENLRCDLGTPLAEVVGELIERHPTYRAPLEAWRDRWIETLPGLVDGAEDLIADLRALGLPLYGLSNFSAETFPWCVERYPIFETFDGIVLSGIEGVAKPDPAIYEILLDRYNLTPERIVFMDDSAANVAAAQTLGMHAFVFTDTASAQATLRNEYGLRV